MRKEVEEGGVTTNLEDAFERLINFLKCRAAAGARLAENKVGIVQSVQKLKSKLLIY